MAGESWLQQVRVAKEVTLGTAVSPATRKMYYANVNLDDSGENRFHDFATGDPFQTREVTAGPYLVGGGFELPVSADELVEPALITLQGNVSPTTPATATNTRDWTFVPSTALDSMTMEYDDGARPFQGAGLRGNSLRIAGSVQQQNMATIETIGTAMVQQALTGTPTERVPSLIEGWETKLYLDAFGATPGTTPIDGLLINWDVRVMRNIGRKFTAWNSQGASGTPMGLFGVEASFTFEAAPSQALTEWNNARAATKRLVRLVFGNNATIETTFKKTVTLDLPGAWQSHSLGRGEDAGTRVYGFRGRYVFDPTNAFGFRMILRNARATAW